MKKKTLDKPIVEGPPLTIYAGNQSDAYVFQLRPRNRSWLEAHYPDKLRINTVLIGFDRNKRPDFQQIQEPIWEHVCRLLTGFSIEEINQIGGFVIVAPGEVPSKDQVVYNSLLVHA